MAEIVLGARDGDFEGAGVEEETSVGVLRAVDGVAENGCTKILEVDTELMGAAGGRAEFEEAIMVALSQNFVISLGGLAVLIDLESGGALEIACDR